MSNELSTKTQSHKVYTVQTEYGVTVHVSAEGAVLKAESLGYNFDGMGFKGTMHAVNDCGDKCVIKLQKVRG